jgi:hypothetical protein
MNVTDLSQINKNNKILFQIQLFSSFKSHFTCNKKVASLEGAV